MSQMLKLASLKDEIKMGGQLQSSGRVIGIRGPVVHATVPQVSLGDLCLITGRNGQNIPAQVVGFQEDIISLAPLGILEGISPGAPVKNTARAFEIQVSDELRGHVLDALGRSLDEASLPNSQKGVTINLVNPPPNPLERLPINEIMTTGIRSIDSLCTIGYGQRIGLFAGAGVGKSTLLGMIARNAVVDISVIALIGERGREVGEFIREVLGPIGLQKSIVVVATSDQPAMLRAMAGQTATAIAEHFRNKGKKVLLLVDSLTRMARAIRDVGLAAGEIPVRQGYTATVYSELPRLLERSGNDRNGSITAFYTVLSNGENDIDPLGEEIKSLLDGQIILSNKIAQSGIRPAIDISNSISRLISSLQQTETLEQVQLIRSIINRLKSDKDLILLGGTPDQELKAALRIEQDLNHFLANKLDENSDLKTTFQKLRKLIDTYKNICEELA